MSSLAYVLDIRRVQAELQQKEEEGTSELLHYRS